MKYPTAVRCCILLAGVLMGCAETTPAPLVAESDPYVTQSRIQYESSTTKDIVDVVGIDAHRLDSGLLKIVLTMRNRTKDDLWVDIRTTFLDERRHVLDQTNWEPVLLTRRTVSEYICTSLGPQAADYQIIIRKPKKTDLDMP